MKLKIMLMSVYVYVYIYSISEEMSSNLTRFLNLFDKFFSASDMLYNNKLPTKLTCNIYYDGDSREGTL